MILCHVAIITSSILGLHLANCGAIGAQLTAKIIDRCQNPEKLLTLEALHIDRLKPTLIQREEYRRRELTLRV